MKRVFESNLAIWIATLVITSAVGWVDWITGHELSVFVLYFIPVAFAAWHLGLLAAVAEAIVSATFWFGADALSGHRYSTHFFAVGNTLVRLCAFLSIGWAIQRIRQLLLAEQARSKLLHRSLAELKVLNGILPICAVCKKIRDGEGHWLQMERYISNNSGASFSHGYCPDCAKALMEEAGLTDAHEK
jgi:hypothetical protein